MRHSNAKECYTVIWRQHREGKSIAEIANGLGWTEKHVGSIIAHFTFYEEEYGKRKGLDAYQPRELMQHLASLGYRGELQYTQKIDITKL